MQCTRGKRWAFFTLALVVLGDTPGVNRLGFFDDTGVFRFSHGLR